MLGLIKVLKNLLKDALKKTMRVFSVLASTTCLLVLFFQTSAHAQQVVGTYTDPTINDISLANKAVSSCGILEEVITKNKDTADILASQAFIELQKIKDGKLLIDNKTCQESILEFVKSLCSSESPTNKLYCERLGIQKSTDTETDGYKTFGQSAIDELGIDLADDIDFELNQSQQDQSRIKFLASGALFYLSPVKKLRFIPTATRAVAARVKPVLSGALLVLATLGLSSCGDAGGIAEPPVIVDTPCTREEDGYFEAGSECIKLPYVSYTFITEDGTELEESDGSPTATIKIEFDSKMLFLGDDGKFSELTKGNVVDMLIVAPISGGSDLARLNGPISEDQISIATTAQEKTVIIIEPPNSKVYQADSYRAIVTNYVKEEHAAKIHSNRLLAYLQTAQSSAEFSISINESLLCEVETETSQSAASHNHEHINSNDNQDDHSFCASHLLDLPRPSAQPGIMKQVEYERADPNTTYVIDVAFILSRSYRIGTWRSRLIEEIIPAVNDIYQNSGVNVRFRVAAVKPSADCTHYSPCQMQIADIDDLPPEATVEAVQRMTKGMQRDYGADLVYGLSHYSGGGGGGGVCGVAYTRVNGLTKDMAKEYAAGSVDFNCQGLFTDRSESFKIYYVTQVLAHEIGHNLGLLHDRANDSGDNQPFYPGGYGYKGAALIQTGNSPPTYDYRGIGTIMSYSQNDEYVPFFSANKAVNRDLLCGDRDRFDHVLDNGFCPVYQDYLPEGELISIGYEGANASEALLYTIKDASQFVCEPGSC